MGSHTTTNRTIHEPITVTIAEQQHQAEIRRRSYELAVQRHHIERFTSAYRGFARG